MCQFEREHFVLQGAALLFQKLTSFIYNITARTKHLRSHSLCFIWEIPFRNRSLFGQGDGEQRQCLIQQTPARNRRSLSPGIQICLQSYASVQRLAANPAQFDFHVDFEPSQEDFGASCPKCHSRALLQPCRARRGREEPINLAPTANTHLGWWQVPEPNLLRESWAWGVAPALPNAAPHSPHSPPSAANSPQ